MNHEETHVVEEADCSNMIEPQSRTSIVGPMMLKCEKKGIVCLVTMSRERSCICLVKECVLSSRRYGVLGGERVVVPDDGLGTWVDEPVSWEGRRSLPKSVEESRGGRARNSQAARGAPGEGELFVPTQEEGYFSHHEIVAGKKQVKIQKVMEE